MEMLYAISSKDPLNSKIKCSLHNCACRFTNFIWISNKLKFIYFETPKCGCTSIKAALGTGFMFSPLHFAMAHLIHSQRVCCERNNTNGTLVTTYCSGTNGTYMTLEKFTSASLLAASSLSNGVLWSDPLGEFEFRHFFGSPDQAIAIFPEYRKLIVVRDPVERLFSAWNMFYNSSEFRLLERSFQCKNALSEKKSFRNFMDNIWDCPNHHFDSIGNFISSDVVVRGGVEVVLLENLKSYWEDLTRDHHLPSLRSHNVAEGYLKSDIEKSKILENEKFLSYYSEDYELMKLAHSPR